MGNSLTKFKQLCNNIKIKSTCCNRKTIMINTNITNADTPPTSPTEILENIAIDEFKQI